MGKDALALRVTMLGDTAAHLCSAVDGGRITLDAATFAAMRGTFERCAPALYRITSAGAPLAAQRWEVARTDEGDVDFRIVYPPARGTIRFDAVHLARLTDPTYGAELTVTGEGTFLGQALLQSGARSLEVNTARPTFSGNAAPAPRPAFGAFLRLGAWHILGGLDHLLFLAGLLVTTRRLRTIIALITCFTVAHSLTLALAALEIAAPSPRVIEPLIAATIVFIGAENLLRSRSRAEGDPPGRALLTFVFGLAHGFGFAGALRDIGLGAGDASPLLPLFAFNLGVELGQAAAMAVALPLLMALRRWPPFGRHGARAISATIMIAGLYWLLQRTIF